MNTPHVDHLGILVEDLDTSLTLYQNQFGFQLEEVKVMPDVGIKIGYLKAQNIGIELIQYLEPDGENDASNFACEVMGDQMGYNHIALRVDDVDNETENKRQAGLEPQDGFPRQGFHSKVCFFSKESTEGVLMEICEHPKDKS